jgi:hypothetical protein
MRALLVLAAVLSAPAAAADTLARGTAENAEQVSHGVLRGAYPGIDVGPVANCVRDNAPYDALDYLSYGEPGADDPIRAAVVLAIGDLDRTRECVRDNNVALPDRVAP